MSLRLRRRQLLGLPYACHCQSNHGPTVDCSRYKGRTTLNHSPNVDTMDMKESTLTPLVPYEKTHYHFPQGNLAYFFFTFRENGLFFSIRGKMLLSTSHLCLAQLNYTKRKLKLTATSSKTNLICTTFKGSYKMSNSCKRFDMQKGTRVLPKNRNSFTDCDQIKEQKQNCCQGNVFRFMSNTSQLSST